MTAAGMEPMISHWWVQVRLQSWVQLHKITSITITITLKYRLQLQLQLHHHNVILNYNYTMFISITITITVPFLRKWYFFMMEYWVNRFWVVFQFWHEYCLVTLPPLSHPTLFGSIISRHLISYMCGTSELDHILSKKTKVVYFLVFFCFRHEFTQIIKFNHLCWTQ